jgi:hypothetical protein
MSFRPLWLDEERGKVMSEIHEIGGDLSKRKEVAHVEHSKPREIAAKAMPAQSGEVAKAATESGVSLTREAQTPVAKGELPDIRSAYGAFEPPKFPGGGQVPPDMKPAYGVFEPPRPTDPKPDPFDPSPKPPDMQPAYGVFEPPRPTDPKPDPFNPSPKPPDMKPAYGVFEPKIDEQKLEKFKNVWNIDFQLGQQ